MLGAYYLIMEMFVAGDNREFNIREDNNCEVKTEKQKLQSNNCEVIFANTYTAKKVFLVFK